MNTFNFIGNDTFGPYDLKSKIIYLTFQQKLVETRQFYKREQLQNFCKDPSILARKQNLSKEQVEAILSFCKNEKISWEQLVLTLGIDLNTPADFVLIYKCPKYFKAFLAKLDIPLIDLAEKPHYISYMESAIKEGKEIALLKVLYEEHNFKQKILVPEWEDEKKEKFVFKQKVRTEFPA